MRTAICKFCNQMQRVMTWDTKPRFALHGACEGSGELVEVACDGYNGPEQTGTVFGKIPGRKGTSVAEKIEKDARKKEKKLDPKLGNSKLPKFYEKEPEGWDDKILF